MQSLKICPKYAISSTFYMLVCDTWLNKEGFVLCYTVGFFLGIELCPINNYASDDCQKVWPFGFSR